MKTADNTNKEMPDSIDHKTETSASRVGIVSSNFTSQIPIVTTEHSDMNYNEYQLTPCQSPTPLLDHALDFFQENFKIDQSMFNPKALLQSMKNEDDEVIPPPTEFGDDDVPYSYSPKNNDNINTSMSPPAYFSNPTQTSNFDQRILEDSLVEDITQNDLLTPSKQKETWTLNYDNNEYANTLSKTTPTQSYTVLHNELLKNNCKDCNNITNIRTGKLNKFKFKRKSKFKLCM